MSKIKCVSCEVEKEVAEYPCYKTGPKAGKAAGKHCKICYARNQAMKRKSLHYTPTPKTTDALKQKIVELYQANQYPKEIAKELSISTETVRYQLVKAGVKFKTSAEWADIRYGGTKKEREKASKLRCRMRLWEIIKPLFQKGCVDCGTTDVLVLEFDHRDPNEKQYEICKLMHHGSYECFKAEIAKCDVVCANCHRKRTARMFGSWRVGV